MSSPGSLAEGPPETPHSSVQSAFGGSKSITSFDAVLAVIVLLAAARGLYIGLIRESFSVAALAGACVAVNYATQPLSIQLTELSNGQIGPGPAPWIAGALIAVATVLAIGMLGRGIRRGARAVGLGWADRLGGIALGGAEGILVAALVVLATSWILGTGHPTIADSRSVEFYEDLQAYVLNRDAAGSAATPRHP